MKNIFNFDYIYRQLDIVEKTPVNTTHVRRGRVASANMSFFFVSGSIDYWTSDKLSIYF
jgi:hypothetical protein